MNRINWSKKWHKSFMHQRAVIIRALGVTSDKGIILLTNKDFDDLHPSIQESMKYLDKNELNF